MQQQLASVGAVCIYFRAEIRMLGIHKSAGEFTTDKFRNKISWLELTLNKINRETSIGVIKTWTGSLAQNICLINLFYFFLLSKGRK